MRLRTTLFLLALLGALVAAGTTAAASQPLVVEFSASCGGGQCGTWGMAQPSTGNMSRVADFTASPRNCAAASFVVRRDTPPGKQGLAVLAETGEVAPGATVHLRLSSALPYGPHSLTLQVVTAPACAAHETVDFRATLKIHYAGADLYDFSAVDASNKAAGVDDVAPGDRIGFRGSSWMKGQPVRVFLGDEALGTFGPDFAGGFRFPGFADGGFDALLTAKQGTTVRGVHLRAKTAAAIVYASPGLRVADTAARPIATGGHLATGERVAPKAGQVLVTRSATKAYEDASHEWHGTSGVGVSASGGSILVEGGIAGRLLTVAVGRPVAVAPGTAPIGDFTADVADGVFELAPSYDDPMTLHGWVVARSGVEFLKGVRLDGGKVFVHGDITIHGGLRGAGLIEATGKITVDGPIDLRPAGDPWSLVAGRSVVLNGR